MYESRETIPVMKKELALRCMYKTTSTTENGTKSIQ
jgi:hypothetical protein